VREVLVDDDAKQATVIVPDDQLSLAIGKDGLNARLAARLTGWRVDIRSETEFAEEEAEMGYQEEEVAGRCAAILANGKRCPNASLPGSRYCGLPSHQELEGKGTDYVVPPEESGGNGGGPEEPAPEEQPADESAVEEPVGGAPTEPAKPEAAAPASEGPVGGAPVEPAEPEAAAPASAGPAGGAPEPAESQPAEAAEPEAAEPAESEAKES
jgi:N utilization substance protein A